MSGTGERLVAACVLSPGGESVKCGGLPRRPIIARTRVTVPHGCRRDVVMPQTIELGLSCQLEPEEETEATVACLRNTAVDVRLVRARAERLAPISFGCGACPCRWSKRG